MLTVGERLKPAARGAATLARVRGFESRQPAQLPRSGAGASRASKTKRAGFESWALCHLRALLGRARTGP